MLNKKKKAKAKAPLNTLSFAANLAEPDSQGVAKPTYIEKGRAGRHRGRSSNRSDRGRECMGWQERRARNNSLDANYRTSLVNTSREGIAAGNRKSDAKLMGMRNRTAEGIAGLRSRTALTGVQMRNETRQGIRSSIEKGMGDRQTSRQTFLSKEGDKKREFVGDESVLNRQARIQQIRESSAPGLVTSGVLKDSEQVGDYYGDEFNDGGLQNVDDFGVPSNAKHQYIKPTLVDETDIPSGKITQRILEPGRVFNETTGEFKDTGDAPEPWTDDERSIVERYYDDATGKVTVPMGDLSDTEINALLKKFKENK